MKCQVCQFDLPTGSTFCTNCGTPVSSNPYGSPSSPNQGIAPTMLASTPPPANPYGAPPSTAYGADVPPANPYGVPPANPYGAPPVAPYGTQPPPAYNPNVAYGAPGAFAQPQYAPPQKKKGPNGCVIAIIVVVALVVLIGGGIAALGVVAYNNGKGIINNAISSANATLTASTSSGIPNSAQIDPAASANLSNAQTASSVDSNYKPTKVTSLFTTSSTIYLTYDLSGKAGYVIEKTYDSTGSIVIKSQSPHAIQANDTIGYISFSGADAGAYTSGLYWCNKSDCSDAALAAVLHFVVA